MTENLADPSTNAPNKKHANLYRVWGKTGAAILMSGNIMVDPRYLECPGTVVTRLANNKKLTFDNKAMLP